MNELLQAALEYAARGWPVFPCVSGEKRPITTHGVHDATINPELIKNWWTKWPKANIAVACGEKSGITVLDVDIDLARGLDERTLVDSIGGLPDTLIQKTPRGGYHALFSYCSQVGNGRCHQSGLLLRNNGGYILATPSVTEHGQYSWGNCLELADFPQKLLKGEKDENKHTGQGYTNSGGTRKADAGRQEANETETQVAQESDEERQTRLERASKYLATCDPAVQGCGGHNKLLYAADRMVNGFCLTDREAYDILAKEFNPRCIPPWDMTNERDAKDFCRKIDEARKNPGGHEPGWLLCDRFTGSSCISFALCKDEQQRLSKVRSQEICEQTANQDTAIQITRMQDLCSPPGLLGEITQWMNQTALIQQPLLSLGAAITFLGALLGRKVKDTLGSRTNLYCMGVAPSSAGKNDPLTNLRDLATLAGCVPLLGGDASTDAALEERMSQFPVTLFLLDEVGHFLSFVKSGISKNHAQVVAMLMKLYSSAGSTYLGREYATKDQQRVIIQPCCSIYGASTPRVFARGLTPEQLDDGWLSRCLVFYSTDRPPKQRHDKVRTPPPDELVEKIRQLYEWNPGPADQSELAKTMPMGSVYTGPPPTQLLVPETAEATKIFIEFDNETIEYGYQNPPLACLWKKGEENARRIALIVACSLSCPGSNIDSDTARYSCDLVRYLLESFTINIAPEITSSEIERRKRKIIHYVEDTGKRGLSYKDLERLTQWLLRKDRALYIEDLVSSDEIVFDPEAATMRYWTPKHFLQRK